MHADKASGLHNRQKAIFVQLHCYVYMNTEFQRVVIDHNSCIRRCPTRVREEGMNVRWNLEVTSLLPKSVRLVQNFPCLFAVQV